MANAWKRFKRTSSYRRTKLFLKRVGGRELWLRNDVDVETVPHGDWRVHSPGVGPQSVVYSLGVGDNIDFDLGLITQFGCQVHAFDPTPFTARWLSTKSIPPGFHFHPWAITGVDGVLILYPRVKKDGTLSEVMYTGIAEEQSGEHGVEVPALTLSSAMKRLGHRAIDLLKMDVEGAEYEVLDSLPAPLPSQVLVEFHHRFPGIGIEKTASAIAQLRASQYRIMAVSESGKEVSFLRLATT